MFPSSELSILRTASGREPVAAGTRRTSPSVRDAIWYRRLQPPCSVTGFPATVNGTAALANSRLAVVAVVARDVKAEDPSRVR